MTDAFKLMLSDIDEAPLIPLMLVLPTLVSVPAMRRGSRLALIAPAILIAQIALWFAYYATDAFSNPGLAGGMTFVVLPLGISWAAAASALVGVRRHHR